MIKRDTTKYWEALDGEYYLSTLEDTDAQQIDLAEREYMYFLAKVAEIGGFGYEQD